MNWEFQFREIVNYLYWLARKDKQRQLKAASAHTRAMFDDAVGKAKAHVFFEKHHYDPYPVEVPPPPTVPERSTRLNVFGDVHNWPQANMPPNQRWKEIVPRAIYPRPSGIVNGMLVGRDDYVRFYDKLVQHERRWWDPETKPDGQKYNLALIEDEAYRKYGGEGQAAWVKYNEKTGEWTLPDDTPLQPHARSYAKERGARRAGLQQMLRTFRGDINKSVASQWRQIVLPVGGAALQKVRKAVDAPQWVPNRLDQLDLLPGLETMPFTLCMRELAALEERMRKYRLLLFNWRHRSEDPSFLELPQNLSNGGPYIWRSVPNKIRESEDKLTVAYTALKILKMAAKREPRPLLSAVIQRVDEGIEHAKKTTSATERLPGDVHLAADEVVDGQIKEVDEGDLKWIKFLGSPAVNDKSWKGRFEPSVPKTKYKLFLVFARRVQKLLDDRDPDGLLGERDAEVTVEELLEEINAGVGSAGVTRKWPVDPYDACFWLDRLSKTGHVRFEEDLACYGFVKRPLNTFFPEHRVIWPPEKAHCDRPVYEYYIAPWSHVVKQPAPTLNEGSRIWQFFTALGFRLGFTLHKLERAIDTYLQSHPFNNFTMPHRRTGESPTRFNEAIHKFESECAAALAKLTFREPGEPDELALPPRTLEEIVRRLDPDNYTESMTADEALPIIRTKIIEELNTNKTMLGPGRAIPTPISFPPRMPVRVWDNNWDWASPTVRGEPKKRLFLSVNRWPLGKGYLAESVERRIKADEDMDPRVTYDPTKWDRAPEKWQRPKLRRYGPEKTRFRDGPARYPVGDTKLQQRAVEEHMTELVHQAVGLARPLKRTWTDRLGFLAPFLRSSSKKDEPPRPGDPWLPEVDPNTAPQSWDPHSEWLVEVDEATE
ncbi:hypothetical protein B0T19DRAFT_410456 [Cercophora scortea]|uniref:Uncharacterized protein n=1 Tax=Cercophora scortea TaxID=314031 RepID=A0AAE0ML92_9PEZI|nr:hypothetical protein B0T19DRAFT_410456 [Cercophora scortea]